MNQKVKKVLETRNLEKLLLILIFGQIRPWIRIWNPQSGIQIRIRIRIKAYADPKLCLYGNYRTVHSHSLLFCVPEPTCAQICSESTMCTVLSSIPVRVLKSIAFLNNHNRFPAIPTCCTYGIKL